MSQITLNISFIDRFIWQRSVNCNFRPGNTVDIWHIDVPSNIHLLKSVTRVLNPDEVVRANRYLRKEDHDRFIISRASLRHVLSKYINKQPETIVFELEPNRKPYISDINFHYNLSDSADQILIAISSKPVGMDVEYIKPKFYYDTILPLNFNQAEIDFINEVDSLHRFFMLWTRKEAILKATGIGLTDHLKQIPSLNGQHHIDGDLISTRNNWKLWSFMSAGNYIATVAADISIITHNFYEFNFEESPH